MSRFLKTKPPLTFDEFFDLDIKSGAEQKLFKYALFWKRNFELLLPILYEMQLSNKAWSETLKAYLDDAEKADV